jgi:uncharacterized protein YjbI with pentapeptide repeats
MADQSHLNILQQGVGAWNRWRARNLSVEPDLSGANLSGTNLSEVDFTNANLSGANLYGANLSHGFLTYANLSYINEGGLPVAKPSRAYANFSYINEGGLPEAKPSGVNLSGANLGWANLGWANLSEADLTEANLLGANLLQTQLIRADLTRAKLMRANLTYANLSGAELVLADLEEAQLLRPDLTDANLFGATLTGVDLSGANLSGANLSGANLSDVNLSGAYLTRSILVHTNLERATLEGCRIYGIAAWSLKLEGTKQQNLNVSDEGEPAILVDNLEVAQFVYLLLNNEKIRDVLNTIGEKGVLILGRFTEERKAVLDAIRNRLRELGFVPMMFDFERPTQQDFDETIKTLAGLSRFIIADITNPKSSPLELQAIMPNYMVPFVPIIQEDEEPFAMFQGLQHKSREWVLDVLEYDSAANLLEVLEEAVVRPALEKADQLIHKKAEAIRVRHTRDYQ